MPIAQLKTINQLALILTSIINAATNIRLDVYDSKSEGSLLNFWSIPRKCLISDYCILE